jgi:hypothetical protein
MIPVVGMELDLSCLPYNSLCNGIWWKRLWFSGPHTANWTGDGLWCYGWEVMDHHP